MKFLLDHDVPIDISYSLAELGQLFQGRVQPLLLFSQGPLTGLRDPLGQLLGCRIAHLLNRSRAFSRCSRNVASRRKLLSAAKALILVPSCITPSRVIRPAWLSSPKTSVTNRLSASGWRVRKSDKL